MLQEQDARTLNLVVEPDSKLCKVVFTSVQSAVQSVEI